MAHETTRRLVGDLISDMSGRSGQEAKRRRAGRLRKEDRYIDRFIEELERDAASSRPHRARRKLKKKL